MCSSATDQKIIYAHGHVFVVYHCSVFSPPLFAWTLLALWSTMSVLPVVFEQCTCTEVYSLILLSVTQKNQTNMTYTRSKSASMTPTR